MDPCPFIRMVVESLALKLPPVTKPAGHGIHPSPIQCFATLHIQDHPTSNPQTTPLPIAASSSSSSSSSPVTSLTDTPDPTCLPPPLIFTLDQNIVQTMKKVSLIVTVYMGRTTHACGVSVGRVKLGRVRIAVDVESGLSRAMVVQSGWVSFGSAGPRLYLVVRTEPDPRYVLAFGGEPECSPVVYQVQGGSVHQPVFSCRFSTDRRRNIRSRSLPPDRNTKIRAFLSAFGSQKGNVRKDQRKGWTVTIHDLCGSPVAAASMITPFVPSPGSDRVSQSNPGAWLILRATGSSSTNNWKPWARFEAWRERGPIDTLGYKFELNDGTSVAESFISVKKGGSFRIDPSGMMCGDDVARPWPFVGGFVMESTVEGEGKVSKPIVHVGVQHVTCTGDIALFVALAAAVDLSMDACQLFSHKLRKELCSDQQEYSL